MNEKKFFDLRADILSASQKAEKKSLRKQEDVNPEQYQRAVDKLKSHELDKQGILTKLGRQYRDSLSKILAFIEIFQYLTSRKKINIVFISTKMKDLIQIFKNHQTISNLLKKLQEIGLIALYDNSYQRNNKAKGYVYSKIMQDRIKELSKEKNIQPLSYKRENKEKQQHIQELNQERLKITERGDILYKKGITISAKSPVFNCNRRFYNTNEEDILSELYNIYPQLAVYNHYLSIINENLPYEMQMKFTPHIKYSLKNIVTKIGIRATNQLCNLPKKNESFDKKSRTIWLNEHYGFGNWKEYDVKSSVPRVAYFLKSGTWLENNIDLYEMLYDRKFNSDDERNAFKKFFMRLYFDTTAKNIYFHIKDELEYASFIPKNEYLSEINKLRNKMLSVLGESIDSEIFLHESCIYIGARVKMLQNYGVSDVLQIYDAFYYPKNQIPQNEIEDCIFEASEEYYVNFILNGNTKHKDCLDEAEILNNVWDKCKSLACKL